MEAPAYCYIRRHAIAFLAMSDVLKLLTVAISVRAFTGKIVQIICVKNAATRVSFVCPTG